jgi:hypothetical protein
MSRSAKASDRNPLRTGLCGEHVGWHRPGGSPVNHLLHHAAGAFTFSQFFMSAAMRSCPAFLIASARFNPCGNFLACARASAARAAQSCLSRSLRISSVMSSSLLWRSQVAVLPTNRIRLHRIGVYLRLMDKTAFDASHCPMLKAGASCDNALHLHARLAFETTRPRRRARRQGGRLWIGQQMPPVDLAGALPNSLSPETARGAADDEAACALRGRRCWSILLIPKELTGRQRRPQGSIRRIKLRRQAMRGARSSRLDRDAKLETVESWDGLRLRQQLANEPANIARLHRI